MSSQIPKRCNFVIANDLLPVKWKHISPAASTSTSTLPTDAKNASTASTEIYLLILLARPSIRRAASITYPPCFCLVIFMDRGSRPRSQEHEARMFYTRDSTSRIRSGKCCEKGSPTRTLAGQL